MAESFLHELHAQFSSPRDQVVRFAERVTGRSVDGLQRIVNGYDNEVYLIESAGDEAVYVRIRREDDGDGFELEARAMEMARGAGVPVPDVLAISRITTDRAEREAMVVRAASGQPLESMIGRLNERDRHAALVGLGRMLCQLHSIRTPGMWRPDGSGHWPGPDELRRGFIADRRNERHYLVEGGLTHSEIERTYQLLNEFPGPGPVVPVLCHGDIGPDHVFVDSQLHVSGLIDWGMWHGGAAVGELAYVSKTFDTDGFEAVLEGHCGGATDDPEFRRAIAMSLAHQQIGHIAHHVKIGDKDGIRRNVNDLSRALAELQEY